MTHRYLSVLFIKYESYVKKMASKSYLDGIMLLTGSQAELRSLDSGKVMSVGKVKRVTKKVGCGLHDHWLQHNIRAAANYAFIHQHAWCP